VRCVYAGIAQLLE